MQSKRSDPANISKLQNQFLRCLLSKRTIILAYLYQHLKNAQEANHSSDPYSQMFAGSQSPDQVLPALAASIYNDLQGCFKRFLPEAYNRGMFFALKELGQAKPSVFLRTTEPYLKRSHDLIKAAILNLVTRLYSKAHIKPSDLKAEIDQSLKTMLNNIALTESMRQKVLGAVQTLKTAGVKKALMQAEYRTAGDDHVCPTCEAYERKIMSLDDIMALIPQHPNCRCWFFPVGDKNDD